ncbi:hypothetical protein ACIRPQ_29235 [Streptomyces sp. NPDC101213]|uniref:hypothetical protein n=1 Tax=Streptomyces sp. NPDC101213 TaxID=3366130 RepID=UPI0038207109
MTNHHPAEGMATLADEVTRILDGDTSSVPPTIRFSAAIKAAGVTHNLVLQAGGGTLYLDQDGESALREVLDGADLPTPRQPETGGYVYSLGDDQMAAYASRLEDRFASEAGR